LLLMLLLMLLFPLSFSSLSFLYVFVDIDGRGATIRYHPVHGNCFISSYFTIVKGRILEFSGPSASIWPSTGYRTYYQYQFQTIPALKALTWGCHVCSMHASTPATRIQGSTWRACGIIDVGKCT
jgi:hypothetical protein